METPRDPVVTKLGRRLSNGGRNQRPCELFRLCELCVYTDFDSNDLSEFNVAKLFRFRTIFPHLYLPGQKSCAFRQSKKPSGNTIKIILVTKRTTTCHLNGDKPIDVTTVCGFDNFILCILRVAKTAL